MNTLAQAIRVTFDDDTMWVVLNDGRTIGVPLVWYPRLLSGSVADRNKVWITPGGLHWDELDEDISILGLLAGRGDVKQASRYAA